METISMAIKYGGAVVKINTAAEENLAGTIYPVQMNDKYSFTLLHNEEDEWSIIKEADATIPFVEAELLDKIVKKLQYELRYAA